MDEMPTKSAVKEREGVPRFHVAYWRATELTRGQLRSLEQIQTCFLQSVPDHKYLTLLNGSGQKTV